jgi:hypothetical protein
LSSSEKGEREKPAFKTEALSVRNYVMGKQNITFLINYLKIYLELLQDK